MNLFRVWVDLDDGQLSPRGRINLDYSSGIKGGRRYCLEIIAPSAADAVTIAQVNSASGYNKKPVVIFGMRAVPPCPYCNGVPSNHVGPCECDGKGYL